MDKHEDKVSTSGNGDVGHSAVKHGINDRLRIATTQSKRSEQTDVTGTTVNGSLHDDQTPEDPSDAIASLNDVTNISVKRGGRSTKFGIEAFHSADGGDDFGDNKMAASNDTVKVSRDLTRVWLLEV